MQILNSVFLKLIQHDQSIMSTLDKVLETLKRIGYSPVYFYKEYKLFRKKNETKEAMKMAAERTFAFLSRIPEIWRS